MGDPLASGVVASLARPGANLTGTTWMISEMSAKHAGTAKATPPLTPTRGSLGSDKFRRHRPALQQRPDAAARSYHSERVLLEVPLATLMNILRRDRPGNQPMDTFIAYLIFFIQLKRMVDLVASNRLPAICNFTEFPKLGGLMGYAPSLPDEFRHAASHIDKILKGEKPADLPVQPTSSSCDQPQDRQGARPHVPPTLLARADEVIE